MRRGLLRLLLRAQAPRLAQRPDLHGALEQALRGALGRVRRLGEGVRGPPASKSENSWDVLRVL